MDSITNNNNKAYTAYVAKCNSCDHNNVCRYKDNYYKILREIERTINEKSYDNMFKLSLDCDHYKANDINIRYSYDTRPVLTNIADHTTKDDIYRITLGDSVIKQSNL